ncbi:AmmeMemoRadiSam system protein B [bacterium]|nr:MAG: AmmeMemoRadiSam system protein B [bacterium]
MKPKSQSRFLPALRRDVQWIPIVHNQQQWLFAHDSMGYCTPNLAFPVEIREIFSFFNGNTRWDSLTRLGVDETGIKEIEQIAELLNEHGVLITDEFTIRKQKIDDDFCRAKLRKPICAESTYPSDPLKLRQLLDHALAGIPKKEIQGKPIALFAPHIDFKVNMEVYAKAFEPLRNAKPRHVYLVGTSHYSGLWSDYDNKPFQFSLKSFEIPGRTLRNNEQRTLDLFHQVEHFGGTLLDYSHRMEHSLELHAIWASHIWKHDFTITPISIGSFEDTLYMQDSALEKMAVQFSKALLNAADEDSIILISGDLSHIGKKFGDNEPAANLRETVQKYDRMLLNHMSAVNPKAIYEEQRKCLDAYHICGFPPIQAVISAQPNWNGIQLAYDYWDESATESAVSFGSVLYCKQDD